MPGSNYSSLPCCWIITTFHFRKLVYGRRMVWLLISLDSWIHKIPRYWSLSLFIYLPSSRAEEAMSPPLGQNVMINLSRRHVDERTMPLRKRSQTLWEMKDILIMLKRRFVAALTTCLHFQLHHHPLLTQREHPKKKEWSQLLFDHIPTAVTSPSTHPPLVQHLPPLSLTGDQGHLLHFQTLFLPTSDQEREDQGTDVIVDLGITVFLSFYFYPTRVECVAGGFRNRILSPVSLNHQLQLLDPGYQIQPHAHQPTLTITQRKPCSRLNQPVCHTRTIYTIIDFSATLSQIQALFCPRNFCMIWFLRDNDTRCKPCFAFLWGKYRN